MRRTLLILLGLISLSVHSGWFFGSDIEIDSLQKRFGSVYEADKTEPFTGKAVSSYEDGSKLENEYKNGVLKSSTEFYNNGRKKQKKIYEPGTASYNSVIEWYKDGRKKLKKIYEFNGSSGTLKSHEEWYQGGHEKIKKDYPGTHTEWYENGQKRIEKYYFSKDFLTTYTEWYIDGQEKVKKSFGSNGNLDSISEWYKSGQKKLYRIYHPTNQKTFMLNKKWNERGEKL